MLFKKSRPIVRFLFEDDSCHAVEVFWEALSKECDKSFEEVLISRQIYRFPGQFKIIFLVDQSIEQAFEMKVREVCQTLSTELRLDESIHDLSEMD